MNAGLALVKVRRVAGISQRELAERAGMPQSTIARIESELVSPRVETLERLLGLCGFRLTLSKLGEGIDRTAMCELVRLTPDQLLDVAAAEAEAIDDLVRSVRR